MKHVSLANCCKEVFTNILWCSYLFIFGGEVCVAMCVLSSFSEQGILIAGDTLHMQCMGFSLQWALLLQNMVSMV